MTRTTGGTAYTEPHRLAPTTPTGPGHTAPTLLATQPQAHTVSTRMPPVIITPDRWGAEQSRKRYISVLMAS